jgi:Guanylylate cyclase
MPCRALENDSITHDVIYKMITPGNVWTIDLAFMLRQFGIDFVYYTLLAGVNTKHAELVCDSPYSHSHSLVSLTLSSHSLSTLSTHLFPVGFL